MSESHVTREPSMSESSSIASGERADRDASNPSGTSASLAGSGQRGQALPGDRGPRNQAQEGARPSFWRRIALGGRAVSSRVTRPAADRAGNNLEESKEAPDTALNGVAASSTGSSSQAVAAQSEAAPNVQARGVITTQKNLPSNESVENRIVEPMLQALVSVEAKLERSHVELVGRSEQVEQRLTQRLTQLWDIEEQLGTLTELQESLLQVSEQQRRLESAVVSQTKTIRWLVGAVFFSLAAAAFVVAAILR